MEHIRFEEAATAFADTEGIIFDDPDHSGQEDRFILIGMSVLANVLMVCHCTRENETVLRIISARKATKNEERQYDESGEDGEKVRDEYDIKALHPRKNEYAKKLKQQITININTTTVDYFKTMSSETGIPYQVLINLYLDQCVKENKKLQFTT